MNNTKFLITLLIAAVLSSTAIALSSSRDLPVEPKNNDKQPVEVALPAQVGDLQRTFPDEARIRPSSLLSQLRRPLVMLGDRLVKPGKERASFIGTLRRDGEQQASPFTLLWEAPGRLRLEDGGRQQVTVFNGQTVSRTGSNSTLLD